MSGVDGTLPTAVVLDGSGNSYVTGNFTGAMTINGATVLANSSPGIAIETLFVAKFSPQGALLWIQRATGSGRSFGEAVAVDGTGNVTVAGSFQGTFTVGSFTLTSTTGAAKEGYVVRYSPLGVPLAAWKVNSPSGDFACTDVVVDASTNSYVTGTREVVSSGVRTKTSFVRKYSIQGQQLWAKEGTGTNVSGGHLVLSGTTLIGTGLFAGTATFSTQSVLTSPTGQYAVGYDSQTGALQWAYLLGLSSWVTAPAVQADASGFYVANSFSGTLVLGGTTPLVGRSTYLDGFVAKFSMQGAVQWAQSMRGSGTASNAATCLSLTPATGQLVVGGSFQGTCTFGSTTQVTSAGDSDLFAAVYTTQGMFRGVRRDGGPASEQALGIAADAAGSAAPVVVGLLRIPQATGATTTTLAGTSFTVNATYNDGFIVRVVAVPLSTRARSHQPSFAMYPNPSAPGPFLIALPATSTGPSQLSMLNSLGQEVHHQVILEHSSNALVSVGKLAPGQYVVRLENQGDVITQMIVIE
ncbi:hypothetical protein GCM10023185_36440 [Hymenobacter saemangeumensis]|uniref:T9SS type A sorting domain-containing protein n=1 Tax=Hymenobacter saemangeumensis TaxID=1084522 RepID=A0ABP8IQ05_9BACT